MVCRNDEFAEKVILLLINYDINITVFTYTIHVLNKAAPFLKYFNARYKIFHTQSLGLIGTALEQQFLLYKL